MLEKACRDIHEGPGFVIIRGLDPVKHGPEDNINLFLGIASYIGDIRGTQDRRGNVLSELQASWASLALSGGQGADTWYQLTSQTQRTGVCRVSFDMVFIPTPAW